MNETNSQKLPQHRRIQHRPHHTRRHRNPTANRISTTS